MGVPRNVHCIQHPSPSQTTMADPSNKNAAAVNEQPVTEEADATNHLKNPRQDDGSVEEPSPKRQNAASDKERLTGKCVRWVPEKKFGFIRQDGSDVDVFCHSSAIIDGTRLETDAVVSFEVVTLPDARDKPRAHHVTGGCEEVAVEKHVEVLPEGRSSGVVLRWNPKGFGFIECDQDGEEVFVHSSGITDSTSGMLDVGSKVQFDLTSDSQGKRRAEKVKSCSPQIPQGVNGRLTGKVLRWNEKGFGFILCDQDSEEVFVHSSGITDGNSKLFQGTLVEFTLNVEDDGKRRAEHVTCSQQLAHAGSLPHPVYMQAPAAAYMQAPAAAYMQAPAAAYMQAPAAAYMQAPAAAYMQAPAAAYMQAPAAEQAQAPAAGRSTGVILRWNDKGFGFLLCDQDSEETFVHATAIQNPSSSPSTLAVGARVEFTLTTDPQGKRRAEMVYETAGQASQQMDAHAYQPQHVYGQVAAAGWQTSYDDQQRPYYFNPATGVSQWEKP